MKVTSTNMARSGRRCSTASACSDATQGCLSETGATVNLIPMPLVIDVPWDDLFPQVPWWMLWRRMELHLACNSAGGTASAKCVGNPTNL